MMLDLFDMPAMPGLRTSPDILDRNGEQPLITRIDATDPTPFECQGWTGKRVTTSFGSSYDFEAGRPVAAEPLPDWLLSIRDRAASFAELDPPLLVEALLILYEAGAGIGWRRDRPVYEDIIGISLGEPATMRFRRRRKGGFERATAPLDPRAVYHSSGAPRHDWEHSIVEMDRPGGRSHSAVCL